MHPDHSHNARPSPEFALRKLLAHCQANDWAGYDPYDALNSRILRALPFSGSRSLGLAFTQSLKRIPFNIRGLLAIPRTHNAKALALFLSTLLNLEGTSSAAARGVPDQLIERIIALRSPQHDRWCWGYSFPWQTRDGLVARGAPNLVCTTFVGNGLLDAYESCGKTDCLEMAASAADYILSDLYRGEGDRPGFSYPLPFIRTNVHNANLLGAAFLARVSKLTGEKKFLAPALHVARYAAAQQREDGSWSYGEGRLQQWIDNFHTGYNLCALRSLVSSAATDEFEPFIQRGFRFYRERFLRADGGVRYFHDRDYPVDAHCVAQTIITLLAFRDLDSINMQLAHRVFDWAMEHMWDERGYFYYRVTRGFTIRTDYMRWSQAWMALALSQLVALDGKSEKMPKQEAEAFANA